MQLRPFRIAKCIKKCEPKAMQLNFRPTVQSTLVLSESWEDSRRKFHARIYKLKSPRCLPRVRERISTFLIHAKFIKEQRRIFQPAESAYFLTRTRSPTPLRCLLWCEATFSISKIRSTDLIPYPRTAKPHYSVIPHPDFMHVRICKKGHARKIWHPLASAGG